jgi:hypothetical protein
MNARNLFIACGIHADSITEGAATELLALNKAQNKGLWAKGQEHGEHVPVWTYALRNEGDNARLCAWLEGHRAHGAKRMEVRPVNGFEWRLDKIPTVGGFVLVYASPSGILAYARI